MPTHHILLLFVCNIVWGFNFVAGKVGTEHFTPLMFSALRFAFVLVLLIPFIRPVPGQMRNILVLGLVMGVGHYSIMFIAIHLGHVVSTVAIASQLIVPFSTLLAVIFLGEQIQWVRRIAIFVSFLGVLIIGFEPFGANDVLAVSLSALAALANASARCIVLNLRSTDA